MPGASFWIPAPRGARSGIVTGSLPVMRPRRKGAPGATGRPAVRLEPRRRRSGAPAARAGDRVCRRRPRRARAGARRLRDGGLAGSGERDGAAAALEADEESEEHNVGPPAASPDGGDLRSLERRQSRSPSPPAFPGGLRALLTSSPILRSTCPRRPDHTRRPPAERKAPGPSRTSVTGGAARSPRPARGDRRCPRREDSLRVDRGDAHTRAFAASIRRLSVQALPADAAALDRPPDRRDRRVRVGGFRAPGPPRPGSPAPPPRPARSGRQMPPMSSGIGHARGRGTRAPCAAGRRRSRAESEAGIVPFAVTSAASFVYGLSGVAARAARAPARRRAPAATGAPS